MGQTLQTRILPLLLSVRRLDNEGKVPGKLNYDLITLSEALLYRGLLAPWHSDEATGFKTEELVFDSRNGIFFL
jgi:hypothetical protein